MEKRVYFQGSHNGYISSSEGVARKTTVFGSNSLMIEVKLEKSKGLAPHQHPQEQTGYIISGKLMFTIDGEKYEMQAGDSYCIPADVEHGVEALENSFVVEVFSPVRKEFLPI